MSYEHHLVAESARVHSMGTRDNFQGHYKAQCKLCKVIILSLRQKRVLLLLFLYLILIMCVWECVREVESLENKVNLECCLYLRDRKLLIHGHHRARSGN